MVPVRLLDWYARWLMRHRGLVLILLIAATAAAVGSATRIRADFSPQDLFTTFEEQQALSDEFKAVFGNTENVLLVLLEAPDVLDIDQLQYVHDLAQRFEPEPFVERVESVTTLNLARSAGENVIRVDSIVQGDTVDADEAAELALELVGSPLVMGTLLNEAHTLTAIAVFLDDDVIRVEDVEPAVDWVEEVLAEMPPPGQGRVLLAGLPHVRVHVVKRFRQDQILLIPLSLLFSAFVSFVAFRWMPAVSFPGVAVIASAAMVVGVMAALGEPINIINQVVPILVIIIGVSDSIHLVSRFQEERAAGADPIAASRRTVRFMAVACFFTSFTTAVGFASLVISRTEILRRFGVTSAVGVIIAYFVTVNLLPVLLSKTGGRAKAAPKAPKREGSLVRMAEWCASVSVHHPVRVVLVSAAVVGGAVYLASLMVVDTRLLEAFAEGDEVWAATELVQDELDGVLPLEISLTSEVEGRFDQPDIVNGMDALGRWIETQEGVLSTTSYADLLHEARVAYHNDPTRRAQPFDSHAEIVALSGLIEGARPDPTEPYVTFDRQRARLNIQIADVGANATIRLGAAIQEQIDHHLGDLPDVEVAMTGDAFVGSSGLTSLVRDMAASLLMAFAIIFVFMAMLFRSVRMALVSVPPNVIPLVLTMAFMGLAGIRLNTTTVVTFSISLGLAVDDTIHMLARFREELDTGIGTEAAIVRAARGAGKAIIVTSITLGGGMMVLLFSSFVPVRQFAMLLGVTVVSCIFGDLLLLPALLRLAWQDRGDGSLVQSETPVLKPSGSIETTERPGSGQR